MIYPVIYYYPWVGASELRNPVGIVETMFADNARGFGNAPWMALPTTCAGKLALDEHHRSIRDSLRQSRC
jgi:hypothetical protein